MVFFGVLRVERRRYGSALDVSRDVSDRRPRQFSIFDIVLHFGAILDFVKVTPGQSGQKVTFLAPNVTPLKNSKNETRHVLFLTTCRHRANIC